MAAISDGRAPADLDETTLDMTGGPRPRRHDDDDDGSDNFGDDDVDSVTSAAVTGRRQNEGNLEEEKELPPHACA